MQIQPLFQTVGQLMAGRVFKIPDYQRAYSWGKKQRDDLFRDIRKVHTGADHFMATMVGLRRGVVSIGADQFVELEIVDGQQRLTTLIILLRSLASRLAAGDDSKEKKAGESVGDLLVKGDGLNLLLLQTNHDSSHIFVDYIRKGKKPKRDSAKTPADQNLIDAIHECEGFVVDWIRGASAIELLALIRNRLSVIFHEIEDEGLVYTVFEVLNSRGLDVTWFDKLKANLMAIVFENGDLGGKSTTLKELHNLWRDTYRTIGMRQNLNRETVRFAGTLRATTRPSKPLSEEDAVDELTTQCGASAANAIECSKWVLRVTNAENEVLANHRLRAVTQVLQARLLAIAILTRDFDEADEALLLLKWENVTFRVYGLGDHDGRSAVGDYVRLAWRVVNEKLSVEGIIAEIEAIGRIAPIEDSVKSIGKRSFYPKKAEVLRYFLFRYDEHLAKDAKQKLSALDWNKIWSQEPSKSIEHIKPQSSGVTYLHRLGNLTVLPPGVNSTLSDSDPADKVATYLASGLLGTRKVAKTIRAKGWTLKEVEAREKALMKWALSEWKD